MQHKLRGFWKTVEKPVFVLAPLYDVTDAPFRHIIAKYGKPAVMWTEFVSADGIVELKNAKKKNNLYISNKLKYSEIERPIVAQLFGKDPLKFGEATAYCKELGFDGVDINMGCPERNVVRNGAGSALINTPSLAQDIIHACKESGGPDFPVSVKTRIGYECFEMDTKYTDWVSALLDTEPDALTLHLRTMKEMSSVDAHWDEKIIERAVEIRDKKQKATLILGNGDVKDLEEARLKVKKHNIDGVMIGRGIFGKPWLWSEKELSLSYQIDILEEHLRTFNELFNGEKYHVMKKHFTAYLLDFPQTRDFRNRLMESQTMEEGIIILNQIRELPLDTINLSSSDSSSSTPNIIE